MSSCSTCMGTITVLGTSWSTLPLIHGVWHLYKHMITMLYRTFMPIICLMERVNTDFEEGDTVPTKVKLLHMWKTMGANNRCVLRLNEIGIGTS